MRIQFISILLLSLLWSSCASRKSTVKNELSFEKKKEFEHYYYSGAKQKALGNNEEAYKFFEQALAVNPSSAETMYQMANILVGMKKLTEATYWSERAVKNSGEYNHWYSGQLAQLYNRGRNYEASAAVFEKMILAEPNRKTNYIEAANQYINYKEYKEAAKVLETYHQRFGIQEETARKLERVYFENNKPTKAIETLQKLVDSNPKESRYMALLAESHMRFNQQDEAKEVYYKILATDPKNGLAHFGLSHLYKNTNTDSFFHHIKAGYADEKIGIQPKLQSLSYFFRRFNDNDNAKKVDNLTQTLMVAHPQESMALVARSDYYYQIKDLENARKVILNAIAIDKSNYKLWQRLMSIDDELQNDQYLYADSKEALELFSSINYLQIIHSYACLQLEKYSEAQEVAESAIDFVTDQESRMQLLSILGQAHHELGNGEESNAAMDELLELNPSDDGVLNNYAFYLSEREADLNKAEKMIIKALEIQPNSAIYQDTYGWILYKKGQLNEAEKWLKKAAHRMDDKEILEHYAEVLEKQGKEELATKIKAKIAE